MNRKYFDIMKGIVVTEEELFDRFNENPEKYGFSFSRYLKKVTGINGSLLRVLDTHKGEAF